MKPQANTYVLTVTLKGIRKREAKRLAKFNRDMIRLIQDDQAREMRHGMETSITTAHVKDVK